MRIPPEEQPRLWVAAMLHKTEDVDAVSETLQQLGLSSESAKVIYRWARAGGIKDAAQEKFVCTTALYKSIPQMVEGFVAAVRKKYRFSSRRKVHSIGAPDPSPSPVRDPSQHPAPSGARR